jgi:hypothetical protein
MLRNLRLSILLLLLISHPYTRAEYGQAKPPYYVSDLEVGIATAISSLFYIFDFKTFITRMQTEHASQVKNGEKMHDFAFGSALDPYEKPLQKHLQNIAKTHHNIENVLFLPTEEEKNYYTNSTIKTVHIRKDHYEYLLYSIHPNRVIIKTEQELKNMGLAHHADLCDTLKRGNQLIGILRVDGAFAGLTISPGLDDLIESSLHHELGHIKYESTTTILLLDQLRLCAAMFPFMKLSIYAKKLEMYPQSMVGSLEFNYKAMLAAIASTIACYTAYRHYDETRADDTVPNDPAKLRALESYFREKHNQLMETIKTTPSSLPFSLGKVFALAIPYHYWEKSPQLTYLFHLFSHHPSYYFRAERFKKRLDELSKKAAQATPQAA